MSNRKMQRRVTVILGTVLAVAMGLSLILPLLSQGVQVQQQDQPTPRPDPTVPAPPDTASIAFTENYLHPSGLFVSAVPTGWEPGSDSTTVNEAQASFRNADQLSLVEVRVIEPEQPAETPEGVSEIFTESWLESSWREYSSWSEDARSINEQGQVVIDFSLTRGRQNFIARQVAYADDSGRVSVIRVVTPDNAAQALRYIIDGLVANLQLIPRYDEAPVDWRAYFDPTHRHLIRYPNTWGVTDAAPGQPASIESDTAAIRLEALGVTVPDEDAAAAWVTDWRADAEVLSVAPLERDGYQGYQVSYRLPSLDGPAQSGVALLLNGPDDQAHAANLLLNKPGVDFNDESALESHPEIAAVLDTFTLFPDLQVTYVGAS